mmetsp:Transcript_39257/g.37676  ORF Transcript_39257/g.37676 Transcript_39257/m.37676 type:complete len:115 (-) Transcript_39257:36-380(-)
MHLRKKFNVKTIDDHTYDGLGNQKFHPKTIRFAYNYKITTNVKYGAYYQYTPIELRDTLEERDNSDFVLMIINLPYFSTDQLQQALEDGEGTNDAETAREGKKMDEGDDKFVKA